MKAKFFIGIMYSSEDLLEKVKKELVNKFGEIEIESEPYDFTKFTSYYEPEIGKKLIKRFLTFKKLMSEDKLVSMKLFINKLEEKYSKNGKRNVNLDPGFLTKEKLVLATKKPRAHRIYLGRKVYADLTLLFKKNSCITFDWTYADFKSKLVQDFFLNIRKLC